MSMSRRTALLHGAALGAGYIASNLSGVRALAQAQPLPQRKSVSTLAPNDPIIETWRAGVRLLREKQTSDRLHWTNLAAIHGTAAGFQKCAHGNWYFLPWHRGYLLMYERLVRQLTGNQQFALPYWDWTSYRQLPPAFTSETLAGGTRNHLYEQRSMGPTDSLPNENVGSDVMRAILHESDFEIFGTSRPRNQNSLDQSWIRRQTGDSGPLEGNPHGAVHVLVGGVMGGYRSANDPIFMMHHCNIDRLWAVWRHTGGVNTTHALWLNMPFQDHFYDTNGSPWSPKVSDLLTTEPLGYNYGDLGPQASLSTSVIALSSKINSIFAGPQVSSVVGVVNFQASNNGTATATQALNISVNVRADLVAAVARPPAFGSSPELLSVSGSRELSARAKRVLGFIRDIETTKNQTTQFRVFLNCPYPVQGLDLSDPHYVATFGFFGEDGGHSDHGGSPSVTVDLTAAVQRVFGPAAVTPDEIRLQILPVARGKAAIADLGTAKPARVEVAFV